MVSIKIFTDVSNGGLMVKSFWAFSWNFVFVDHNNCPIDSSQLAE